jgi:hypothetical protein
MTAATVDSPYTTAAVPRLSVGQAVGLQILPGVPALVVFLAAAALFANRGLPVILALYVAILVGEVPATWAVMVWQAKREGRSDLASLFPWRRRLPRWQYLAIGLPLAIVSLLIMGSLQTTVAESLRTSLFAWVPQWAVLDMAGGFEGISRNTLLTIWILGLVSATLLGGATQELFARGFLLPRTAHLGHGAPVLNAAAFAVLHLVSPWSWPVFFLVSLPWAFAVFRTRSIQLGLVGHVGMLVIMWLGMTAMLFRA